MYHNYHKLGSVPPYLDGSMCWTNASSTQLPSLEEGLEHVVQVMLVPKGGVAVERFLLFEV